MSKLQVDDIVNKDDTGSVGFSRGAVVTGVMTATSFSGALTGNATGLTGTPNIDCGTGSFTGGVGIADSIFHTGDDNTQIRFPAADTFTIETGGTERFRVDSGGDVGIGTATVDNTLHVYKSGDGQTPVFFETSNGTPGELKFYNDSAGWQLNSGGDLRFATNGSTRQITIDTSGRLMLGTTTEGNGGADQVTISTSEHTGVTLRSGTTHQGNIFFADGTSGDNEFRGIIRYDHNDNSMQLRTDATEALRIDSSQRLLIGADTSTLAGTIQAKTQIVSSDFHAALAIRRNQNSDGAPQLIFFKNRGTSNSSNTVVQDDDGLGNIRFYGNDGTDFAEGAQITARVDGTPGSNDMPGALEFKTSADGAEAPVVKFTIDSAGDCTVNSGNLVIGTNGNGIDFSADGNAGGMTSELLDDYEEGTYTPSASGFTVSGTTTMTGKYVKIGQQVTVGIKFANTGTIQYGVSCNITLPFTMASGTEAHGLIGMLVNNNAKAFDSNQSGTQCKLDGEGGSRFFVGNFTTTSSGEQLMFGGTYISNQ